MECYTSDSDSREVNSLDLHGKQFHQDKLAAAIDTHEHAAHPDTVDSLLLGANRIPVLPALHIDRFVNLRILEVSSCGLKKLPEIGECMTLQKITSFVAKNNQLTDESLSKSFLASAQSLRELNLSGNMLRTFPTAALNLPQLKYLYLAANKITAVPRDIHLMTSLQILVLGSNEIVDVPDSVGQLKNLQMLVLSDNKIVQLPASIGKLNNLKSLRLHKNKLRALPTEIITLKCLTELSLRDNPLVMSFVRDISLQPPTLLELAARVIKLYNIEIQHGDIPASLFQYLSQAHCCVNPKCKGVFFDSRVEHIKFVDFCGKYRLPLLQYLCSSKCIMGGWESRDYDPITRGYMMKKVLLG